MSRLASRPDMLDVMLNGGLEHLKIETRLIDEMFASVMGECDRNATVTWYHHYSI